MLLIIVLTATLISQTIKIIEASRLIPITDILRMLRHKRIYTTVTQA